MEEESKVFEQKKAILLIEKELIETKHRYKMEELAYERLSQKLVHDQILERGRIARAEEKKMIAVKRAWH